jgi:hypothetical protein
MTIGGIVGGAIPAAGAGLRVAGRSPAGRYLGSKVGNVLSKIGDDIGGAIENAIPVARGGGVPTLNKIPAKPPSAVDAVKSVQKGILDTADDETLAQVNALLPTKKLNPMLKDRASKEIARTYSVGVNKRTGMEYRFNPVAAMQTLNNIQRAKDIGIDLPLVLASDDGAQQLWGSLLQRTPQKGKIQNRLSEFDNNSVKVLKDIVQANGQGGQSLTQIGANLKDMMDGVQGNLRKARAETAAANYGGVLQKDALSRVSIEGLSETERNMFDRAAKLLRLSPEDIASSPTPLLSGGVQNRPLSTVANDMYGFIQDQLREVGYGDLTIADINRLPEDSFIKMHAIQSLLGREKDTFGRQGMAARDKILQSLDAKNPAYKDSRNLYREQSEALEDVNNSIIGALSDMDKNDYGSAVNKIFRANSDQINEMIDLVGKYGTPDAPDRLQSAFAGLVLDTMENAKSADGYNTGVLSVFNNLFSSEAKRTKVKALFGDKYEPMSKFFSVMEVANRNRAGIRPNSITVSGQQLNQAEQRNAASIWQKSGMLLKNTNMSSVKDKGSDLIFNQMNDLMQDPTQARKMFDLLFTDDGNKLVQRLNAGIQYNPRKRAYELNKDASTAAVALMAAASVADYNKTATQSIKPAEPDISAEGTKQ